LVPNKLVRPTGSIDGISDVNATETKPNHVDQENGS
jgi:hypothetical protein